MEEPIAFADRCGAVHVSTVAENLRKRQGQYFTPPKAARFMADLLRKPNVGHLRMLDPGIGSGILSCAAIQRMVEFGVKRIEVSAYEIDEALVKVARDVFDHAETWAGKRGCQVTWTVTGEDFTAMAAAKSTTPSIQQAYDIVISNPPYFKLGREDRRAQAAGPEFLRQPNIYSVFMALAAKALNPSGQLLFITPRSYTSGPYFTRFRQELFKLVTPEHVHVFHSRGEAFGRDEVLQENLILAACRRPPKPTDKLQVTTSHGLDDLGDIGAYSSPLEKSIHGPDRILRIPENAEQTRLLDVVDAWTPRLKTHGWRVSTGPVVAHRTPQLEDRGHLGDSHAACLWLQHVQSMNVTWPLSNKDRQYVRITPEVRPYLVPNENMVLLRRFSTKEEERRIVAAPYLAGAVTGTLVGLENKLNYIVGETQPLTAEEALGLAAFLTSEILDKYFRISNGNTQVSATELRAMPLPAKQAIRALGSQLILAKGRIEPVINQALAQALVHG